jgi:ectoine hydroxylase-related dioxygenase (phytanoyl-CoA dioxygenase family)
MLDPESKYFADAAGCIHAMKLSPEQITQYRTEGYTTVPDFFDTAEVAAMQAELQRLKDDGLLNNVATEGDGKTASRTAVNLQICPLSPKSEFFRSLGFADKVVNTIRQLIGDPVVWQLDQIFLKPGRHGAGTSWHQDNAYFRIKDRRHGVGMWTAIHAANVANGTMHVIPRGDAELLEHERDGGSSHHVKCVVDESKAVPVELPAGGVLFFNYAVPHCTKGNTTDRERAGLALHFLREDAVVKPEDKLAILTGPNATHGVKEFGADLRGAWKRQVEKMTATA